MPTSVFFFYKIRLGEVPTTLQWMYWMAKGLKSSLSVFIHLHFCPWMVFKEFILQASCTVPFSVADYMVHVLRVNFQGPRYASSQLISVLCWRLFIVPSLFEINLFNVYRQLFLLTLLHSSSYGSNFPSNILKKILFYIVTAPTSY